MAPKEPKLCKQAVAGTTRHVTFAIPDTLEIIRKPGNAIRQSNIKASIQDWIVEHAWYKETQGNIICKNLG
jgi:hypothetical protein